MPTLEQLQQGAAIPKPQGKNPFAGTPGYNPDGGIGLGSAPPATDAAGGISPPRFRPINLNPANAAGAGGPAPRGGTVGSRSEGFVPGQLDDMSHLGAGGPPPVNDPTTGMPASVPGALGTPHQRPQFDPTTGDPIARPSGAITSMQQQHPTAGQGYTTIRPNGSGFVDSGTQTFGTGIQRPRSTVIPGQTGTLGQQRPGTMGSGGGAINPPPPPISPTTSPVGEDLRGDVYTPGADPRLQGAMSASDAAAAKVQGYDRGAMQSANEGRYRSIYGDGQVSGTMDALNGAPDRTALAKQTLADFMAQQQEQQFNEERDLGRNISKFGRTGLQANADNYGDILRKAQRDRAAKANELASSVAEGDINDRFRKVDMQTGLAERNADRGFQRTNAALTQAGNQTDRSVGDLYDQNTAAGSLEDRIFGQGQSNRNEYRTERQRQDQQSQQSIENRIREMEAQNNLEDQRLRRAALLQQAGGGY